jgi:N-methylhydantoinase A
MAYRLGVDVGGTFTDLFLVDDGDHRQWRVKTPSTPQDPAEGVLTGVRRICTAAGIDPADLGTARPSPPTRCWSPRAPASA